MDSIQQQLDFVMVGVFFRNHAQQQMAAVQEIASLLGESTAKAKIALINFKNTLKEDK